MTPDTFEQLNKEIIAWQDYQFPKATVHSKLKHLKKEIDELAKDPSDAMEYADCYLLLVGAAAHAGVNLLACARLKLEINKNREWGEPDADGVVYHIKGEETIPHE